MYTKTCIQCGNCFNAANYSIEHCSVCANTQQLLNQSSGPSHGPFEDLRWDNPLDVAIMLIIMVPAIFLGGLAVAFVATVVFACLMALLPYVIPIALFALLCVGIANANKSTF